MKLYNRVWFTTATTGTGTITVGSAVQGYRTPAQASIPDGTALRIFIQDGAAGAWEESTSVYTVAGTTLTRVLVDSSTGSLLTLAGPTTVFITAAAEDLITVGPPQGRLTISTGVPAMTATVAGATSVFYTPYVGQDVPLYDGTSYTMWDTGGEISQTLADTTKSPAAVAASSNYDVFAWNDAGTIRATRGPAWTSATARGTGVGTTELNRIKGFWLNKNAITNGPAANRGTWLGSFRSNASSTVDFQFGSNALGGGQALIYVWNAYNRVPITMEVTEATGSWTQSTSTVGPLNASTTNRISILSGLAEDCIFIAFCQRMTMPAVLAANASSGFAMDSTTTYDRRALTQNPSTATFVNNVTPLKSYLPQLGQHFFQALQASDGTNTATWNGSGVATENSLSIVWQY